MKIAIDAREMVGQIAGKGRYVAEVVAGLAKIDNKNSYVLYSKQPLGVKLPANFETVTIGGLPGLRQVWLANDAKRRDCDILFAPTGYLPVVFSRIPTVVTIHDLAVFVSKEARPALRTLIAERLLLGLAARRAQRIISVSESTKRDLIRLFRTPEHKIDVTLLGYDRATYQAKPDQKDAEVLTQYSLQPEYLLFIGTLEPRKNIEGIIRAYAKLSADLQAKHPLVIGGKKGWYYDSIFTTVKELSLEEKVQFLGRVPDEHLPALYRQAKVFLFPSFYEGFGLPPLEAMACGTPVITSNLSSLPEVVGEAGILVNPHSNAELSVAMKKLLSDEELYQSMVQQLPNQVKKFSWDTAATQTLEVFQKCQPTNI